MIHAIGFDYSGVIELLERNLLKEIIEYLGCSRTDWEHVYFSLNHLINIQGKPWGDVIVMTAAQLGTSPEQLTHIQTMIVDDPRVTKLNTKLIKLIKKLKASGLKIGLISNYTNDLRGRLIDQGIIELFDSVIVSAEVGYQKPSPEIFQLLADRLEISIGDMAFVDDTRKSLEGADLIGYSPILYRGMEKLIADLALLGIKTEHDSLFKKIFIFIITTYQRFFGPMLHKVCVFEPSCSEYTKQAVSKYGALRGSWMGAKRIASCHPWQKKHYDPLM